MLFIALLTLSCFAFEDGSLGARKRQELCVVGNTIGNRVCHNIDWKMPQADRDAVARQMCAQALEDVNRAAERLDIEERFSSLCDNSESYGAYCLSIENDEMSDSCTWLWTAEQGGRTERRGLKCFANDARVMSRTRGEIQMKELEFGEDIATCNGGFTTTWAILNRAGGEAIEFTLDNGETLTVTHDHYVVLEKGELLAKDAVVGDVMSSHKIVSKKIVVASETFNIVTTDVHFLVNGVCATHVVKGKESFRWLSPIGAALSSLLPKNYVVLLGKASMTLQDFLRFTIQLPQMVCFWTAMLFAAMLLITPIALTVSVLQNSKLKSGKMGSDDFLVFY